jgi:hypothetical protein
LDDVVDPSCEHAPNQEVTIGNGTITLPSLNVRFDEKAKHSDLEETEKDVDYCWKG